MKGWAISLPTRSLYLGSSGWTAIAVSPSIVSILVVATSTNRVGSSFKAYLKWTITPNYTFFSYPGTFSSVLFSMSMCYTSISEIAVFRVVDQFTNLFAR